MPSLNHVRLIGHLGADPEIRNFSSGGRVANLRLATSERWKDKTSGEKRERTEWHTVAVFNDALVGVVERYCRKGSLVMITGALETRKWQDQQGQDRYSTEVVLRPYRGDLLLMDPPPTGRKGGGSDQAPSESPGGVEHRYERGQPGHMAGLDDDIPF